MKISNRAKASPAAVYGITADITNRSVTIPQLRVGISTRIRRRIHFTGTKY
jgi:hypothetical protein